MVRKQTQSPTASAALQQYASAHIQILAAAQPHQDSILAFHEWFLTSGRDLFLDAFEHETSLPLRNVNRSEGALIEHGFPKNVNEYDNKTAWDNYYVANALMFLRALDDVMKGVVAPPKNTPDIFWVNLLGLTKKLYFDSLVLLEDWATFKQKVPGLVKIGKNRLEHIHDLFLAARQLIYGNYGPFSAADNHSDTATNQLRMALELRLRRGFGIIAKTDKRGAVAPLSLSTIIEAIGNYRSAIAFSVPFDHIERIYGWANIYMHSGLKQYTWSIIHALNYLSRFLMDQKGIAMTLGTIRQVQSAVEASIDKRTHRLEVTDPREWDVTIKAR